MQPTDLVMIFSYEKQEDVVEKLYTSSFQSPIGLLYVAATPKGICKISLDNQEEFYGWLFDHVDAVEAKVSEYRFIKALKGQIKKYFRGKLKQFAVPLDLRGTPFQIKVWNEIAAITYGNARTYKELAAKCGTSQGYRAIGNACRHNPLPIVIPCHRVVGQNHDLGGFSGGLEKKINMLKLEGRVLV
jgi:methylated-DNA-[protein]-cysteine S-methyltransferase